MGLSENHFKKSILEAKIKDYRYSTYICYIRIFIIYDIKDALYIIAI